MIKIFGTALVLLLCSFSNQQSKNIKTVRLDSKKSTITYHLSHPLHEWDGVSKDVVGVVQLTDNSPLINKVAITVKISTFDSKNSNRDSHLLEVTEAIKYPSVTFVSTLVKDNGSTLEVTGKITFHNVTKEVQFTAQSKSIKNNRQVTGSFILLMEDFNIERPSLMMVKTDNQMKMSFSVEYPMN
jgi:polyisoprenoid-binding protein YceI